MTARNMRIASSDSPGGEQGNGEELVWKVTVVGDCLEGRMLDQQGTLAKGKESMEHCRWPAMRNGEGRELHVVSEG